MTSPPARDSMDKGTGGSGDGAAHADRNLDTGARAKGGTAARGDGGAHRDRDAAGRPRNARPRDELGRPLSRGAAGAPPSDNEVALPPASALSLAQQLIRDDRPFRAHEVLEAAWKAAPAAERELWQGLAQVAVGLTHAQRGNSRGAVALLRRGARRVSEFSASCPHGIDAARIAGSADGLADLIERAGLAVVSRDDLHVRLTPPWNPDPVS